MKFLSKLLAGALAASLALPVAAQPNDKSDKTKEDSKDPSIEPVPSYDKVKKGSLDDVNAIGNREIGGKGLGNWYSLEKEVAMGKQYAQQVEQSAKLVSDPVINEYVNRIGQNLVRHSDAKVPFTIKVIDDDQINAFALPGGFFYVNTGTILAADDESELPA
jgi:predicted Zn-dependent protease